MPALVLQSDFGTADGAVSAMYGVALGVDPGLRIFDLTHEIPPYDIWEGSYRLTQTIAYWLQGTVFVSVVDPGVGTDRLSVVAKTKTGHYVVTPDNGTLTHLAHFYGIEQLRQIDETVNRLPFSGASYTFHGRDVYAYTGARLASGVISYEQVGPEMDLDQMVSLTLNEPITLPDGTVQGSIDVYDVRYGSLWTNISRSSFEELTIDYGRRVLVTVREHDRLVYTNTMVYARSFAEVNVGEPLVYVNSLDNMAVAINRGSFAQAYNIGSGRNWLISLGYDPMDAVKRTRPTI